jgi:hypothetical protein
MRFKFKELAPSMKPMYNEAFDRFIVRGINGPRMSLSWISLPIRKR